jgi:hypothetical protein
MDNQAANKPDELLNSAAWSSFRYARRDRRYSMSKCWASATVWLHAYKINTKLSATNFRQLQC